MKSVVAMISLVVLFSLSTFVYAQHNHGVNNPVAEVSNTLNNVTSDQLTEQAKKVSSDWEKLGWMGAIISAIGFLILLLRYKPVDKFLEEKKLKYLKPYFAVGLGTVSGFLTALSSGSPWYQSVLAGLIAGLAVPGAHQVLTGGNKMSKEKQGGCGGCPGGGCGGDGGGGD